MALSIIIGIDLGTTNLKVSAYDHTGGLIATATRKTTITYHENGWSEFDVEAIWNGVYACLQEVISATDGIISAIGISSFGESNVLLDKDDHPVYPMITWFDTRTLNEPHQLTQHLTPEEIYRITGQFVSPKLGICKTMWVQQNEPEAYGRATLCLTMLDYILYQLTGVANMDYTMAARMMLLDIHTLDYAQQIIEASGLKKELFPPIRPSGSVVAPVKAELVRQLGLKQSVPVLAGGHDHSCAAIAAHIFDEQTALDSMGTAETTLMASDTLPNLDTCFRNHVSVYPHFGKKLYRLITSIHACGVCLAWANTHLFGGNETDSTLHAFSQLLANALNTSKAQRPIFCPTLRGLQEAPSAQGSFFGISDACTQEDLAYAVAEGLSFEAYRRLSGCLSGTGTEISCLRVVGGPSNLKQLIQMKSDIFEYRIQIPVIHDAACLGAALIAGLGSGAIQEIPPLFIETEYTPNAASQYQERYPLYQKAINLMLQF